MKQKKWVNEFLNERTDDWRLLVMEGYADPNELDDCELKTQLFAFKEIDEKIEKLLERFGYEPG